MARTEYRKGGQHAGGGGHKGAGGKKGRPPGGWEKGDITRDIDDSQTPYQVPVKPGRKNLLQDPPEVKARRIAGENAARKKFPKLSVTFLAPGLDLTAKLRNSIKADLAKIFSGVPRVQSAIVSFDSVQGSIENLNTICEIKVKLRGLQTTFVEFIAGDLRAAYQGAARRILDLVRDTLKHAEIKGGPRRSGLPARRAEA